MAVTPQSSESLTTVKLYAHLAFIELVKRSSLNHFVGR